MSQFHHRGWHNSIAVGNYLYIDGGEVVTWNGNGAGLLSIYAYSNASGNINTVAESHTRAIDLSTSWTNQTVKLYAINKNAPILCREALWPDANGETFYLYDGGFSDQSRNNMTDYSNQLWQFSPSGNAGEWSLVAPSSNAGFKPLTRIMSGSYAYGDGVGFALGGVSNSATGLLSSDSILTAGLVEFNTTTQQWDNVTTDGFDPTGKVLDGAGHFVPSFGPNGLLLFMGGAIDVDGDTASFGTVSIYDPTSRHWETQTVSGEIPNPCVQPCVVGAAGDNGTYEIFLYGGDASGDAAASVEQGAVHVLTLPAFRWMKQSTPPNAGRTRHSCNLIGNRQMVVVGGLPITLEWGTSYIPPDPWSNGIGIFDLSAMEWASLYDANALPYVSPKVVKDYYQNNPQYPSWSSSQIETWFTQRDTANTNANTNSNSKANSSSVTPKENPSDKSNVAAIAGGTVGGVVGILLLVGLLIWVLRERRRRRQAREARSRHGVAEMEDSSQAAPAELEHDIPASGMLDSIARHELHTKERRGEMSGSVIYELGHDSSR